MMNDEVKETEVTEKERVTKFITKSKAFAYALNQERTFKCDPRITFAVEERGGGVYLCKYVDYSESDGKKEENSILRVPVDGCSVGHSVFNMTLYLNQFRPIQEKVMTLGVDMGISSSVWLLGKHSNHLNSNFLFSDNSNMDLFRTTLSALYTRMYLPTTELNDYMRLSWAVHFKCFEVFGDQIVDLFLPKKQATGRNQNNDISNPKIREHPQNGIVITGLARRSFKSADMAYEALQQAFHRRHILLAETSVNGSHNLFGQRVLGTVGCVFIQIEVEQVLYPTQYASQTRFDPKLSFKYENNLQFNVLADIEALSFKPSKHDKIAVVPLDEFSNRGSNNDMKDDTNSNANTAKVNLLATSHKSLSTLARVLRLLTKQEGSTSIQDDSSTGHDMDSLRCPSFKSSISSAPFIPYRDSTLTRVLQPSLEGNYANFVFLCVGKDSNSSISHALRMTMDLRGMPQHVERRKCQVFGKNSRKREDKMKQSNFDSPQTINDNPDSEKDIRTTSPLQTRAISNLCRIVEGSGPFVGQVNRIHVDHLPTIKASEYHKGIGNDIELSSDRRAMDDLDEERATCEENIEKSFWDILALYKHDQCYFLTNAQQLENLEYQRRKQLDCLDMEVSAAKEGKSVSRSIPQVEHAVPASSFSVNIDQSRKESRDSGSCDNIGIVADAPKNNIEKFNVRKLPSRNGLGVFHRSSSLPNEKQRPLPLGRPQSVGSFAHFGHKTQMEPTKSANIKETVHKSSQSHYGTESKGDYNSDNSPLTSTVLKPLQTPDRSPNVMELTRGEMSQMPEPVGIHPVQVAKTYRQQNVVDQSCNDSFPVNDSLSKNDDEKPSLYDNVDFVQLSISTSNLHFDNPSGFINICEQQKHLLTNNIEVGANSPRSHYVNINKEKIDSKMMTGKNIWASPHQSHDDRPYSPPKSQTRPPQLLVLPQKERFTDKEGNVWQTSKDCSDEKSDNSNGSLITVPDLGLTSADVKIVVKPNGVVMATKNIQSKPALSFPSIFPSTVLDDTVTSNEKASSPIRVSVRKRTSPKGTVERDFSDDGMVEGSGLSGIDHNFMRAVSHSNLSEVKKCVASGVNIHLKNSFERDALQVAARNGDLDIVQFLALSGANLSTRGRRGDTLFHIAASNGHVHVMRWLVEQGRMYTLLDMHGQSAAHVAARRGEVEVLRYLHEELHMNLNEEDFEGLTPLQHIPRISTLGNNDGIIAARKYLSMLGVQ